MTREEIGAGVPEDAGSTRLPVLLATAMFVLAALVGLFNGFAWCASPKPSSSLVGMDWG